MTDLTGTTVHIVNGDSVATSLAETDLPGEFVVHADALDQGPVRLVGDADYLNDRAAYWAGRGHGTVEANHKRLAAADAAFDLAINNAAEVVLWYEHDLFDQLTLVRLISRFGERPRKATLSMVSIDRHPDVAQFLGLGQLESHQLAALWPQRTPIARDILEEAAAAWVALTAVEPRGIHFVARRVKALPFLAGALERHLEEFPDSASGLVRTERHLLAAIARGIGTSKELFALSHEQDPRYVATDISLAFALGNLQSAGFIEKHGDAFVVTARGTSALAGKLDRVADIGMDAWRGGVQLSGHGPVWRWDSADRKLSKK